MDFEQELSMIKTLSDKEYILDQLDIINKYTYQTSSDIASSINSNINAELAKIILNKLSDDDFDISQYLKLIRERIEKLDTISLAIAFRPSNHSINSFLSWVQDNISKDIVLDISINEALLGGAVIIYKGKYMDYSLLKNLNP